MTPENKKGDIDDILIDIDSTDRAEEEEIPKEEIDEIANLIDLAPESPVDGPVQETIPAEESLLAAPPLEEKLEESAQPAAPPVIPEPRIERVPFQVKGSKSWNTKDPYVLPVDEAMLAAQMKDLSASFYFIAKPHLKVTEITREIKKEIFKFLIKPSENIIKSYTEFLNRELAMDLSASADYFKIRQDDRKLFYYHLGPATLFRAISKKLEKGRYGYCYKYSQDNKAIRFFPSDFMKEMVLGWFQENINPLDLPFDSIQNFEEIKNRVLQKYTADANLLNARLNELQRKIGKGKMITRDHLVKLKGDQWFSSAGIWTYRRFVDRSVFG